ncbi:MAG: TatD family hydrolase [bacterium]|nr:TatD family hydrolase [bacterium]
MKLFDSHTHVQFSAYDNDREEVIKRAREAGVKMICVGTQFSTSEAGIKLAEKYPDDIWASVGFHPNHAVSEGWHHDPDEQSEARPEKFDSDQLEKLALNPKVVAIGECGLDYYRIRNDELGIKNKQKEVFLAQAEIAQKLNKALMIHCRSSVLKSPEGKSIKTDDAYEDLFNLMTNNQLPITKVIHFFAGSLEIAKKLLNAGCYFTFGGVITFTRDYDEAIKYLPLDRILLETDAPYVAPEPYRGKRNEPAYVVEVAKKMAEFKGVSLEKVAEATTQNNLTIFRLSDIV